MPAAGSVDRAAQSAESGSRILRRRAVSVALVLAAMLLTVWVRMLPLALGGVDAAQRATLRFAGADGREHVYLGDFDSYYWLRAAQHVLQSGSICDRDASGDCRDELAHAPFGALAHYPDSLHVASIAWLHRLATWVRPDTPLSASAFWVPVVVGALVVIPAFAIGAELAGPLAGLCAALVIALNPLFLGRSIGGDNDVWNVLLPLCLMWAAMRAVGADGFGRQAAYMVLVMIVARWHAVTWNGWMFTYAVVALGLVAHLASTLLQQLVRGDRAPWTSPPTRRAAASVALFGVASLALVGIPGVEPSRLLELLHPVREVFRTAQAPAGLAGNLWPEAFSTVGELTQPSLRGIANTMLGVPFFFVGWLGLLGLLLPDRRWQWWHFAMLIAGNYLYAYLLTRPTPGRGPLLLLLGLSLAVAMGLSIVADDADGQPKRGAALLVVGWFLAALWLAFDGTRFAMLLLPPFGIVFGVAVGRLQRWLSPFAARLRIPAWVVAVPLAVAALYLPIQRGSAQATSYVPQMDDAWWDAFSRIRAETPPETIVTTWWPYGYWAEYVAERRTSVDGGSLPTRVPYWLARALFAPTEAESVGLLRMLDCGSDFHPLRGQDVGAYDLLLRQQIDPLAARTLLVDLVRQDRRGAADLLAARGIGEPRREHILAMTHCHPPEARLVLSNELIRVPGWKFLGSWSFDRAYAAALRQRPQDEAVAEMTARLDLAPEEARTLWARAARLPDEAARRAFIAPPPIYDTPQWVACRAAPGADERVCPLDMRRRGPDGPFDAFTYRPDAVRAGRLRWTRADGTRGDAAPALIIAAGATEQEAFTPTAPLDARIGVLVDLPNDRILVGTPELLRSTFTQLMFLDGRYARALRKIDERIGFAGNRVVTWAVDWPNERSR
jgi:dolichyl-diphosphooligosaccharide--protein glycosyltransferase